MKKGLFITFEGGDGSGKSTQIQRLQSVLQQEGYDVLLTREPGGTQISEQIRGILLDPENKGMAPMTETMLYAAARAQLVEEVIRPALQQGTIVICDRFLDSSIAYQAFGRDLGSAVLTINSFGIAGCMPDLTIYLRVDPQVGRSRISTRAQDRIESESESFHRKVFEGYEAICAMYPERILPVDAAGTIEEIGEVIRGEVMRRIAAKDAGDGETEGR